MYPIYVYVCYTYKWGESIHTYDPRISRAQFLYVGITASGKPVVCGKFYVRIISVPSAILRVQFVQTRLLMFTHKFLMLICVFMPIFSPFAVRLYITLFFYFQMSELAKGFRRTCAF
jgi:hypothetical protein